MCAKCGVLVETMKGSIYLPENSFRFTVTCHGATESMLLLMSTFEEGPVTLISGRAFEGETPRVDIEV